MRIWIIATALALLLPTIVVARPLFTGPQQEQLVEGHTTFAVIRAVPANNTTQTDFAAAVAVLVREIPHNDVYARFPGVLWFNDQYLITPSGGNTGASQPAERYPCGAIIVANQGDAVPTDGNGVHIIPSTATYVESYYITDPRDNHWITDKWTDGGVTLWSVATGNGQSESPFASAPDDGVRTCGKAGGSFQNGCYPPFVDDTPEGSDPIFHEDPVYHDNNSKTLADPLGHEGRNQMLCFSQNPSTKSGDQSPTPYGYICGSGTQRCNGEAYNAVVFFFLEDLTNAGAPKNHTKGSTDYNSDVSGCSDPSWPCPAGDDNREGNSHPYNPIPKNSATGAWPNYIAEGRNNHGGSADCTGDSVNDANCHATRNVDIYFGYRQHALPTRTWRVFDAEGSTAPYYCEPGITYCNEGDVFPGM